jgi:starch-binding outer membrane protein, SusD/RagB family
MKKLYSIILIIAVYLLNGCDALNEKLDLYPISSKNAGDFYVNESEFTQAIAACYNSLRNIKLKADYSYMLTEARSDNVFQNEVYDDGLISRFEETELLPVLSSGWQGHYGGINWCNLVITNLENFTTTDIKSKDQIMGEAKFIRAVIYFNLVRLWGSVPIIDKPISLSEAYSVERSTVRKVYDFIEADLQEAITLLPALSAIPAASNGRACKNAAKAYLGKVLVFESGYPLKANKWNEAKTLLKEVMDSGDYLFFSNYADIYLVANELGKQSVFSLCCKSNSTGQGNNFPSRNAPNQIQKTGLLSVPFGGSPYGLMLTDDMVNAYEPGDLRKDVSIQMEWYDDKKVLRTSDPFCIKYKNGTPAAVNDWDADWIDYRYDEGLLLYAECLNELGYVANGEAFTIVNKFRTRAGLKTKSAVDVPNQAEFRLWLEKERRIEFCFENIRWFDLVRTDRAEIVLKAELSRKNFIQNISKEKYFHLVPQRVTNENPKMLNDPGFF